MLVQVIKSILIHLLFLDPVIFDKYKKYNI